MREIIEVPGMSDVSRERGIPILPAVKANGFVFVSGTPPIDIENGGFVEGSIGAQTERCLQNIRFVLEQAGSSLEKVCMVRVYANSRHYAEINEVYARFFPTEPPARTFVPVGEWPMKFDIEIDCVALQ